MLLRKLLVRRLGSQQSIAFFAVAPVLIIGAHTVIAMWHVPLLPYHVTHTSVSASPDLSDSHAHTFASAANRSTPPWRARVRALRPAAHAASLVRLAVAVAEVAGHG